MHAAVTQISLADRAGLWTKWSATMPVPDPAQEGYSWFADAEGARWCYRPEAGIVLGDAVGMKADGETDDWFALTVAQSLVASEGGILSLPSGVIRVTRPFVLTKRQTRLVGRSFHETYIGLDKTSPAAIGPWMAARPYVVGDIVSVHEVGHDNAIPYRCTQSHIGSRFDQDWAAGRWELWCVISIRASDCGIEYCNVQVPAMGIGIAVQGAARFNPKYTMFVPESDRSGIGLLLDDRDHLGAFSPGSYTHLIGPGNGFANLSQGKAQLHKGIATAGTPGGINASRIIYNHFVGDLCAHIQNGGGNAFVGNLMQSASGGNSGSRPFSGGIGTGVKFGGETHFEANYLERFECDFEPSSSSARYTVGGHSSDASNRVFPLLKGYSAPSFVVTGAGVGAEVTDGMGFLAQGLTRNGEAIMPRLRGITVSGNGVARTAITISRLGCTIGQRLLLQANSWPFQIVVGDTVDLAGHGARLTMGQPGSMVGDALSESSFAEFIFTPAGQWRLLWRDEHIKRSGTLVLTRDNEAIAVSASHIDVSGGATVRSGIMIGSGPRLGHRLVLTTHGNGFSLASQGASWGMGGAPTMGMAPGQVLSLELLWTAVGWVELGRTVRG